MEKPIEYKVYQPGSSQNTAQYGDDAEHMFHREDILVVHRQHDQHAQYTRWYKYHVPGTRKQKTSLLFINLICFCVAILQQRP